MRIAYVEDNPTNLALVQRVATMGKHEVVSYTEGEVAMVALLAERYDLILMDVELAGEINGLDVVRHLRKNGIITPIVAVTAYAMVGDRDKCIEAGCNDYLPKPLPITQLVGMLERYQTVVEQQGHGVKPQNDVVEQQGNGVKPQNNLVEPQNNKEPQANNKEPQQDNKLP